MRQVAAGGEKPQISQIPRILLTGYPQIAQIFADAVNRRGRG
jgi:hypothetical protein